MSKHFLELSRGISEATFLRSKPKRLIYTELPTLIEQDELQFDIVEPLDMNVFKPISKGTRVAFPADSCRPTVFTVKRLSVNGHALVYHAPTKSQLYINLANTSIVE